ncbi:MAG: hypothetical protein ACTSVC_08035 [Promethearchaeota archaeon]
MVVINKEISISIIIIQLIALLIVGFTDIKLALRYRARQKTEIYDFFVFGLLNFFSIFEGLIGHILNYYFDNQLHQTELGILTNYTLSFALTTTAIQFLYKFNFDLFEIRNNLKPKIIQLIGFSLFLLILSIPNYFNGEFMLSLTLFKMLLPLLFLTPALIYFLYHGKKLYNFLEIKSKRKKLLYLMIFYILLEITYIFYILSALFNFQLNSIFLLSTALMSLAVIFGTLGVV